MTAPIPAWVDGRLRPVDKLAVHRDGLRHMAVSVFVLCGEALLLQRRAQGKYHTPGLWANTCCSHPQWGERAADCAVRRLREELGVTGIGLQPMGRIEYRADVGGGMVEHEVVDVFAGHVSRPLPLAPDPEEVMQTRWTCLGDLAADVRKRPGAYTPWLRIYLQDGVIRAAARAVVPG
ncbi:MAG: isopentenyl-diphosphate delta-isomerase [Rhodobacteraceae bacterium]|nr:isopentenyl-diphosphate delta-isomerase [Paracoccaceae bacterium]